MVLVSHAHKFIYLKTRKTAGTSTEMILQPFCTPPGVLLTERSKPIISERGIAGSRMRGLPPKGIIRKVYFRLFPQERWHGHMKAFMVASLLGEQAFGAYSKIANIRNPFRLAVSHFNYRYRSAPVPDERYVGAFRRFVREEMQMQDPIVMCGGVPVVDHWIRFEHLREDLERLGKTLAIDIDVDGLPHVKDLRHRRRSDISFSDLFDDATTALLRDRFEWMFDVGGYSREVPS